MRIQKLYFNCRTLNSYREKKSFSFTSKRTKTIYSKYWWNVWISGQTLFLKTTKVMNLSYCMQLFRSSLTIIGFYGLLPLTCKMNYVNMQHNHFVKMRPNYVDIQFNLYHMLTYLFRIFTYHILHVGAKVSHHFFFQKSLTQLLSPLTKGFNYKLQEMSLYSVTKWALFGNKRVANVFRLKKRKI